MKCSFFKRIVSALMCAAVLSVSLPVLAVNEAAGEAGSVVILHTNDMHGALVGSSSVIGADRIAAQKKLDDAILVDGGDAVQGVALASQSEGESVIKIMNAAGYDVMALGNHEFDYGLEQLRSLRELADFPMISANTFLNGGILCGAEDNNGENVLIEKNGVKVGIFALTTSSTMTSTKPENLVGVEFRDEVETAKFEVAQLDAQGADVIIALVHMGVLEDQAAVTSRALAQAMKDTELDAIIDGHSHTVLNEVVEGTNITLAQTGTGSANVGRMEITVAEDGSVSIEETLLARDYFENVEPDAAVSAVIDELNGELAETLKEPVGDNVSTLWGGSVNGKISESRAGETNLGDLICDSMIAEARDIMPADKSALPIVAIENGGGFRTAIPNGQMTKGSFIDCLPFANAVMTKEITPAVLYAAVESFVSSVTAQDTDTGFLTAGYSGSFPQIGGMSFEYDPNADSGAKVPGIYLDDGTALDRNDSATKLILVSNDYVIGNALFADCPFVAEGRGLTETVLAHVAALTENGTKALDLPVTQGRIRTANADPDRTYTAHVAVTGENVPSELAVTVDGKSIVVGTVADGVMDIVLPDGPHALKLYGSQREVYVNNYSGNGIIDEYNGLELGWPELAYSETDYEAHTNTEVRGAVAADCEHDGYTGDVWCLDCGVMVESGTVIPAAGHDAVKVPAVEATHHENGNIEYFECTVCHKIFADEGLTEEITLEDTVVPKGEHVFGEWVVTKAASASENGSREKTCSVCGYKVTEEIPRTGSVDTKSPQTGDTSSAALWAVLFVSASCVMALAAAVGRKKRAR